MMATPLSGATAGRYPRNWLQAASLPVADRTLTDRVPHPRFRRDPRSAIAGRRRAQIQGLEDAIRELDAQIARWSESASFTVADTSVYFEHEDKLRDLDFAPLLPGWQDKTVRVVVPIIILDELDGLKRTGDAHRRWRAGYTLAVMEEAFASLRVPGLLRDPAPDGTRGGVILDLLFDPPGHVRLPINDDEIIDRALAAQALAGTHVTLLTFDTSQAARARNAGLKVNKLTAPLGEEPPDSRNRKAKAGNANK